MGKHNCRFLTGDFLFAKSSDLLADLGPAAVRLQARTFERLVNRTDYGRLRCLNPGQDPLEHYLKVVADKTGSLIAASASLWRNDFGCTCRNY